MNTAKRILMSVNGLLRSQVFCRRTFLNRVFGVHVLAPPSVQSYCEWGTILIRQMLPTYLRSGMRVLDMGTGAHALLAIYCKRSHPETQVVACDIVPARIEWARRTAQANHVAIDFRTSDLFDRLEGQFDLVLFAPPVIPSADLKALGFQPQAIPLLGTRYCWSGDGGQDGLDVLRSFLEQLPGRLSPTGRAIVTVNPAHFSADRIRSLCQAVGFTVERIHRFAGIANGFVLTRCIDFTVPTFSSSTAGVAHDVTSSGL